MPTRFYLPSVGTPTISPAYDASWEVTTDVIRRELVTTKTNSAELIQSSAYAGSSGAGDVLLAQYISPAMAAQTISGTVKGIIAARETNTSADMRAQLLIKVVSNDGTTVRGTLLAHQTGALASEFSTSSSLQSRKFPHAWTGSGTTLSSLAVQNGDRLVIEIGYRSHKTDATSYTGRLYFRDDQASDRAEDETGTTGDPWIELSHTLQWSSAATHDPRQGAWRWYTDAADASMQALAAQNVMPVLSGAQMQDAIVRLRFAIAEIGGLADSSALHLQYSEDGINWGDIASQTPETNLQGRWFRWANGAATASATLATTMLSGTTHSGVYLEAKNTTATLAANAITEYDAALRIHWPPPDTVIKLRVTYNGTPLPLASGATEIRLQTSPIDDRPYTVGRYGADGTNSGSRELRYAPWHRVWWDGDRWWLAWHPYDEGDGYQLNLASWTGQTGQPWQRQSVVSAQRARTGRNQWAFKTIGGVKTIFYLASGSSGNYLYRRGTISGTTITWAAEQDSGLAMLDRSAHTCVDDGNYRWIGGIDATNGQVWAARSTNVDTGTAWTAGFNTRVTATATGIVANNVFHLEPVGNGTVMAVWYNTGTSNLHWALVTNAGFGTVGVVNATAATHRQDWNVTRAGDHIWVILKASAAKESEWLLRRYTISTNTWASAASSGIINQPSDDDGLTLTVHGDDLYIVGTWAGSVEGGGDRVLRRTIYHGPGLAGTWEPLADVSPQSRGNGDGVNGPAVSGNNQIVIGFEWGDDTITGTGFAVEAHTITLVAPPAVVPARPHIVWWT